MRDRATPHHWLPVLLETAALVWGAALVTVIGILSRLREPSTVVTGSRTGTYTVHVVETPVLQLQGVLPYLPGTLVVVCAGAALVTTLMVRGDRPLRPDMVCWGAAGLVVATGLISILTIGVTVLPAAALLVAAAARLGDERARAVASPGRW